MARGTVVGEKVVSQANTNKFRDGYDRTFGDKKPVRGKWVVTPNGLVSADEYVPPSSRSGTGIMVDRFMEGDRAPDGSDIGSRQKRKRWMRDAGVVDYADCKGAREKRAKELAARHRGEIKKDPALREMLGRELYKRKVIL